MIRTGAANSKRTILIGLVAFALLMAGWSALLSHNLSRGEALFAVVTDQQDRNTLALSADFLEYRDYYRDFPGRFRDMTAGNSVVEYYKRPLYGPVSATLSVVLRRLGVHYPTSMYLILSFYAAAATLLLFLLLRRSGLPRVESVLLTGVGASSFAWLSVFSLPESYSLSVCAALLAMHSGVRLPALDQPGARWQVARHALVSGVAGWVYLPVCGAALLVAGRVRRRSDWLRAVAPAAAMAALITFVPHAVAGGDVVGLQLDYAGRWTALSNFTDASAVAGVGAAFLFFGVVSPVADFLHASPAVDFGGAMGRVPTLVGLAVLLCAYAALVRLVARNGVLAVAGPLLWMGGLFLFHVFYNPGEVLLYLSVPVTVLVLMGGSGLATWYGRNPRDARSRAVPVLAVVLVVTAAANIGAILGARPW